MDYPGVGPEHSFLKDLGRAEYYSITDEEALEGKQHLPNLWSSVFHLAAFVALVVVVLLLTYTIHVYAAFKRLSRLEGIIPALETSHALAYLEKLCPTLPDGTKVVLNCSGRGDKDVQTAIKYLEV